MNNNVIDYEDMESLTSGSWSYPTKSEVPIEEINDLINTLGNIQGVNTEITASSYNDYVPSTKAVYDYVNAQIINAASTEDSVEN